MYGARLATGMVVAFCGAVALFSAPGSARAAIGGLSEASEQCLGCHGAPGLDKKLPNGETLSLHVDASRFAKSVHGMLGCAVCHADLTLKNHPPLRTKVAGVRENSLALVKVCRSCHPDKFKQYEGSIHAALVREGNPAAPICTDCHNPHAVMAKAEYDESTGAPCSKCHGAIFRAYAGSVHGQARKRGIVEAPVCSTCHSAHAVKAAAGEDKLKETCLGCHTGAVSAHQSWLPNAKLHLQVISCPACHAPGARRRVDLRLYNSGTHKRIETQGVPRFETRVRALDNGAKGLNASELQLLLREVNSEGLQGKVVLRGRLEVDSGVEAHQLADKNRAVHRCETCHRAGSDPFQRVTISIADPNGRPLRYAAHEEVLSSPISIESAGGFYVIGGTRIKLLDVLVVLALAAGIGVPLVHLTAKWWFRRYAKKVGDQEES